MAATDLRHVCDVSGVPDGEMCPCECHDGDGLLVFPIRTCLGPVQPRPEPVPPRYAVTLWEPMRDTGRVRRWLVIDLRPGPVPFPGEALVRKPGVATTIAECSSEGAAVTIRDALETATTIVAQQHTDAEEPF